MQKVRRLVCAVMLAAFAAGTATVLHASSEDYNDNWVYCRSASPLDPYYWWYRCYLPEDPELGRNN